MSLDEKDLQAKWNAILDENGLSMERGSEIGHPITYGQQYFDDCVPFDYVKPDTNTRQVSQNFTNVQKLLRLMEGGMSQRAAAKAVGLAPQHASRAIKRYRKNQPEGENQ